ncbi:ATP-binding protein [Phytohabitans kaempferiae]|uniref:ATP-binding protein n=1 Tax=Phytohabitans kaempferiae TaxID=1620943 RepID=A0ABV6MGN8_9ACTN
MSAEKLAALAALRFNWAQVPDDVWRPSPFHVDGLYPAVVRDVLDGIAEAGGDSDANPVGLVLEGRAGTGKTHLLGWVRQQVQKQGGYFFLISLLDSRNFWDGLLVLMLDSLARQVPEGGTQLNLLLRRLSSRVGAPRTARRAVMGETELSRASLDSFIDRLTDYDQYVANTCRDTARALALRASLNEEHQNIADNYFACGADPIPDERQAWGIRRTPRTAQDVVRDISWLLALTGPTVIAFDQIDTMVSQSALMEDLAKIQQTVVVAEIANGLTALREHTRRTFTVVAALSQTWKLIESKAIASVVDRFRRSPVLEGIRDPAIARQIVEKRFATRFGEVGFTPDYPTWPVRDSVFQEAINYSPRRLLIEIDRHIRACLIDQEVRELSHLGEVSPAPEPSAPEWTAPTVPEESLARIDARFEDLKRDADVTSPLEGDTEDATFPELLSAGLRAWIAERGDAAGLFSVDPPPSDKPDLHARLRRELDERPEEERADDGRSEDQEHWCFRAISDTHHGVAALHRLRRARTAAGLTSDVAKRKLFLIRNGPWSSSGKTQQAIREFARDGGTTLAVDDSDLRVLAGLHGLRDESPIELQAWLVERRPTAQITLFKEALSDAEVSPLRGTSPSPPSSETGEPGGETGEHRPVRSAASEFVLGTAYEGGEPVPVSLESFRKHVAIFAGSGSGKTVLLRRVVEECALQGVSAIVLDPNNDLARLGEPWPEPPAGWGPADPARAADYLANTEVVVWTPRRETGRPLSFQPLPDFGSVRDDPDEFGAAVDAAVAALAPRANLVGRATKVHLGLAVLRRTVEHYGRRGGSTVQGLIDTLADLPDGVSGLADANKIAADLAQTLTASMDNDPLFGGSGTPADPGLLLTPTPGKRARISVVSMVGLGSDESRQSFVNQLQMSLFAWIKKNPARDRPLLGLFVMDEAQTLAPSGQMTACTQSTLALAAQARKYGLGLVFATQAPRGLHNRIPGNAATQFFGFLNTLVQVDAAREMAKVKGGDVPDISRLRAGEFYVALEGEAPQKVRTPFCLSHHPPSPLTEEEVMARARKA